MRGGPIPWAAFVLLLVAMAVLVRHLTGDPALAIAVTAGVAALLLPAPRR